MKILITTPTGKIGARIVPELLAPEFSVRVLAREPDRLAKEIRDQAEVFCGSSDDPAVLRRALDGIEALFWCVPTASSAETKVEAHYERFAYAAWQAVREAGTPRVVTISAGGERSARRTGPLCGLHAMEKILDESGAAIRHLRCGLFMENFLAQARFIRERGFLCCPLPGHKPMPFVAVTDIADAALRWLVRRDWQGIEGVDVRGPEALSGHQAAAVLERVLERPVQYRQASAEDYVEMLVEHGASIEQARGQVEMFAELAEGILSTKPDRPAATTMTTLAAWAESELLPAVESLGARWGAEWLTCKS